MKPRTNFAPISDSPSTLVRVGSGYLIFNGAFSLLIVTVILFAFAFGFAGLGGGRLYWPALLAGIAAGAGMIWTGILIGRRRRLGGLLALGFLLLELTSALLSEPIRTALVIFSVIGVLVVVSIWGELR